MVATFIPALDRISQTAPDAVTLLRIFSFCDPESIPISILKQGCGALDQKDMHNISTASAVNELKAVTGLLQSSIRLSKAIQEIQRLSLAVYAPEGTERTIRTHDLVQLLLRSKLIVAAEREQWLELVICIVCKAFDGIGDRRSPRNWSRCSQFISHIEFMGGFAAQYKLGNATLLDASTWVGIYFNECGLYGKAAGTLKQTWDRQKAVLGEEHPDTLSSMANLASTYSNQGRWKEAEELEVGVMETRKRVLGEEHPHTLTSMNNLAFTWKAQSQDTKAVHLIQECIRLRSRILGVDHPDTLSSSAVLAEWQGPETISFVTNNMTITKGESKQLDEASGHGIHSGSRRKRIWTTLRQKFRS